MDPRPLTKTEFRRGLGCIRRAWLDRWRPELRGAITPALQERFDTGRQIGELAWHRYPEGRLAAKGNAWPQIEGGATCLFEPTFESEGRKARLDVIWKSGGGWTIDEVKMATAKPIAVLERSDYVIDLAFQVLTVQRAGLEVEAARLVMVDNRYIWTPPSPAREPRKKDSGQMSLFDPPLAGRQAPVSQGQYDASVMLTAVDLTLAVGQKLPGIAERSTQMIAALAAPEEPVVEINRHCKSCDYAEHCLSREPKHCVIYLPRIKPKEVNSLRLAGFNSIHEIPDEYGLAEKPLRVRDVIRSGKPFVSPELAASLGEISFPAAFIDYETSGAAFPVYPGTRPYQAICFQWSAHVLDSLDAEPVHYEFLAPDTRDPRKEFCRSLKEAVSGCRSIIHYSGFEVSQMRAMVEEEIPLAAELLDMLQERSFDLERIVDQHVYLEAFMGRTSIKHVLPALVPELTYADLDIADGQAASAAFRAILAGDESLRRPLLEYCKRDTLAMVEVYRALRRLAAEGRP